MSLSAVDLAALLRRYKPERHTATLRARPIASLASATTNVARRVMLDTTAIIHNLAGRLPPEAAVLIDTALHFHCSVCIAEIAVGLANYDPNAANAADMRAKYVAFLERVPSHRILTPSAETWAAAGIISGTLARTQRLQPHQRKEMLNDALIYLTACGTGCRCSPKTAVSST